MKIKYEYRCPHCGKVTVKEYKQDFKPTKTEIVQVCVECRKK